MKKIAILVCVLLQVACAPAQNTTRILEGMSMSSASLKQDVRYSVILPEGYFSSKKSYPVIYLLHGLGDNESSWLEYGRVTQAVDAAVRRGELIPMIYVMPQGYRNYYVNDYAGKFPYEDMFISELVPHIDKQYRTMADKEHRATMGYSMGGFGALVLPLRNPELFTVSVPLSISVRTDEQYTTEEASGWDDQWGRLFGSPGLLGEERLTEYYKQHSPFHLFAQDNLSRYKNLRLYIDNGDDEETLCRSNEELHILLRDKKFPHEFRVRDGGHEFSYWREALPNGLRFISDAFEGKSYRGDKKNLPATTIDSSSGDYKIISESNYIICLPAEYDQSSRQYPVVYILGNLSTQQRMKVIKQMQSGIGGGTFPPVLIAFIKEDEAALVSDIIPQLEKKYRARSGFRFRALIGLKKGGGTALSYALQPELFTSCAVIDAAVDNEGLANVIHEKGKKALSRTWLYILTTDQSENYRSNGQAHILFRQEDIYHEYRVMESNSQQDWWITTLDQILDFTQRKIHR